MPDAFVPLGVFLHPSAPVAVPETLPRGGSTNGESDATIACSPEMLAEYAAAFGAVRRFRAAVADAIDAAVQRLLDEIAQNVLARELTIAGADVASVVAKTRERFFLETILTVRVHPRDREALLGLEIEKIADDALRPGDVIVELRSGTIDLRLVTRLEIALAACTT